MYAPRVSSLFATRPNVKSVNFRCQLNPSGLINKISPDGRYTTKGPPVFAKARRLCLDRLACAKAAFDKLLADGIVRRSDSPWSSPLHMVPKSDGSWRPCGNFRHVNEQTDDDCYPLPHIQDFGANLQGLSVFSLF